MRRIEECRRICPDMDYVVIASGTAAEAFKEVTDGLKLPKIVAIGPQTAKACESRAFGDDSGKKGGQRGYCAGGVAGYYTGRQ